MHVFFPVQFDEPVYRVGDPTTIHTVDLHDDFDFVNATGLASIVSGHDSSSQNHGGGTRLTNLTGVHAGQLSKQCTKCEDIKPLAGFGEHGRTVNDVFRDQAQCNECR